MLIAILIALAVAFLVYLFRKDQKKNGVPTVAQETAELLAKAKAGIVTESKTVTTNAEGVVESVVTTTLSHTEKAA